MVRLMEDKEPYFIQIVRYEIDDSGYERETDGRVIVIERHVKSQDIKKAET